MIRDAGEVYSVQYTKKIGSVYRSVYCIYICILPCYTTLSSNNTSRLYTSTLLPHLYDSQERETNKKSIIIIIVFITYDMILKITQQHTYYYFDDIHVCVCVLTVHVVVGE